MKNKAWSIQIFSVLLLVCMFLICIPMTASAANDYVGITVSDEHTTTLQAVFQSVTKAQQYASTEHTVTLIAGKSLNLGVEGYLSDGYRVTWSTSNQAVARIDSNGVVSGRNLGSAVITATCINENGDTILAHLNVNVVSAVAMSQKTVTVSVNKLCDLNLNLTGDLDTYVYNTKWSVSDGSIIQTGNGLVLGQKAGIGMVHANVYYRGSETLVGNISCEVNVVERMSNVAITNKVDRLEVGSSLTLLTTTEPSSQKAMWTSSNTDVAIVDAYGRVTAVGVGTATITAYGGCWQNNQYVKDTSISDEVTITVWASSVTQYNATLANNQDGNVTLSTTSAYPNEVVIIYANNIVSAKGTSFETKGATIVSVIDSKGRAIPVEKAGAGVFTFTMPADNVTINPVYSSLYQVSVESGLIANTARNDNVVARLLVSEYVSGSFGGQYTISSDLKLSGIVCDYATVRSSNNGVLSIIVSDDRSTASKFTIELLADAQSIVEGKKGIRISGDANITFANTVYTYFNGELNTRAEHITLEKVQSLTTGSTLKVSAADQIVIYGEALQHIQKYNISLYFEYIDGILEIPATSLKLLSALNGGFTVFDFVVEDDPYGDSESFGVGKIGVKAYTSNGLVQEQLTMIGKTKITIKTDGDEKLSLSSTSKKIESVGKNTFELNSMAGFGTFTIMKNSSFLDGDLLFILVVVVLLILLGVALVFLIRRLKSGQLEEHAKVDSDEPDEDPDPTPDPDMPINPSVKDEFREDDVDIQSFKTVDDILKESNLEYKAAEIMGAAVLELNAEINREVSEYADAQDVLLTNDQFAELKYNLTSLNLAGIDVLEEKHIAFETSMRTAERVKSDSVLLLKNETTTEVLHKQADSLRDVTSVMMQQRTEYGDYCRTLLTDIEKACLSISMANALKERVSTTVDAAREVILVKNTALEDLEQSLANAAEVGISDEDLTNVKEAYNNYAHALATLVNDSNALIDAFENKLDLNDLLAQVENGIADVKKIEVEPYIALVQVCIDNRKAYEEAEKAAARDKLAKEVVDNADELRELINNIVDGLYDARQQESETVNDAKVVEKLDAFSSELISYKFDLTVDVENADVDSLTATQTRLNAVRENVGKTVKEAETYLASVLDGRAQSRLTSATEEYNSELARATGVVNHAVALMSEVDTVLATKENPILQECSKKCNVALVDAQALMLAHVADDADALTVQKDALTAKVNALSDISDELYELLENIKSVVDEPVAEVVIVEENVETINDEPVDEASNTDDFVEIDNIDLHDDASTNDVIVETMPEHIDECVVVSDVVTDDELGQDHMVDAEDEKEDTVVVDVIDDGLPTVSEDVSDSETIEDEIKPDVEGDETTDDNAAPDIAQEANAMEPELPVEGEPVVEEIVLPEEEVVPEDVVLVEVTPVEEPIAEETAVEEIMDVPEEELTEANVAETTNIEQSVEDVETPYIKEEFVIDLEDKPFEGYEDVVSSDHVLDDESVAVEILEEMLNSEENIVSSDSENEIIEEPVDATIAEKPIVEAEPIVEEAILSEEEAIPEEVVLVEGTPVEEPIVEEPVDEIVDEPEISDEPEAPAEPEISDEPVAESNVEEPAEDITEESTEEAAEETVEEPEVAPVFTDAQQTDDVEQLTVFNEQELDAAEIDGEVVADEVIVEQQNMCEETIPSSDDTGTFTDVAEIIRLAQANAQSNDVVEASESAESIELPVSVEENVEDATEESVENAAGDADDDEEDVSSELATVEHVEVNGLTRNELLDEIRRLAEREALEYDKAMMYLSKSSRFLSEADKEEFRVGITSNHEKFRYIYDNLENTPDSQLTSLIDAVEQIIKDMILIRGITSLNFEPKRLSRKKLNYWRTQAASENPYISFVANAKLNAHKMRIKMGVQSRKANEAKQKANRK